jgi:hypothetical protein
MTLRTVFTFSVRRSKPGTAAASSICSERRSGAESALDERDRLALIADLDAGDAAAGARTIR